MAAARPASNKTFPNKDMQERGQRGKVLSFFFASCKCNILPSTKVRGTYIHKKCVHQKAPNCTRRRANKKKRQKCNGSRGLEEGEPEKIDKRCVKSDSLFAFFLLFFLLFFLTFLYHLPIFLPIVYRPRSSVKTDCLVPGRARIRTDAISCFSWDKGWRSLHNFFVVLRMSRLPNAEFLIGREHLDRK